VRDSNYISNNTI